MSSAGLTNAKNDIISYFLKHKELEDLEEHLQWIEERLKTSK